MDLLLGVCFVFILLIIHAVLPSYIYDPNYGTLEALDLNNDLRTGDVILMKQCIKCKYTDNYLDNGWLFFYKNIFNTFRWYLTDEHYTHVAIVLRIDDKPYICHVDKGSMYDVSLEKEVHGTGLVISPLEHMDSRGGIFHLYKYTGPTITQDLAPLIKYTRNTCYPKNLYELAKVNGAKCGKHTKGIMACTDFIEYVWHALKIVDTPPSRCGTLTDIFRLVRHHPLYNPVPYHIKNKCYNNAHFK
jgi:hypothetical protein